MSYFWAALGWLWSKRLFFAITFASALAFFALLFPFGDLSDVVTSAIARGTRGAVYVQFNSLALNFVPQPAVSATDVSVETSLPPLKAKWAKITPSLFSALFSLPTLISAANGNPEAAASLSTKLGLSVAAEDLLGSNLALSFGPGSKSEQGNPRSRVTLAVEKLNLGEVQKWADLPMQMNGRAALSTDVQFAPDFKDQPDGEFTIKLDKFVLPASVVQVDMNGAMLPVNLPALSLANVAFKGHLSRGTLTIDEGTFGRSPDAIFGRIKGSLGLSLVPAGPSVNPVFGSYNLIVDMTTSAMIEKELSFAFIMLGPGKSPAPGGGGHYLFRATGQGIGMAYVPNIVRINTF